MELRRADMVRLHDKLSTENGPVIANRVVELLRRIFNWYSIRNEDFHSPIVRGMTTAEVSRDRVLTDGELREIWKSAVDPALSAYVRFLLLTAARRNEAAEMKWSEVAEGTWTLPASRNKTGTNWCVHSLQQHWRLLRGYLGWASWSSLALAVTPWG
jgi:integrase